MKKTMLLGLALCTTTLSLQSKKAVILVHGAFIAKNTWMNKNSKFYTALQKATNSLVHIESFFWDQPFDNIFALEKINAAKKLADLIIKLCNTGYDHLEIYAHSYGSHIVAIASQLLCLDTGKLEIIAHKTDRTNTMIKRTNEYQAANEQFLAAKYAIEEHLAKTPHLRRNTYQNYFITMVHTLATPQEEVLFQVNMNTIGYLINCWSREPIMQQLVGTLKQDFLRSLKDTI